MFDLTIIDVPPFGIFTDATVLIEQAERGDTRRSRKPHALQRHRSRARAGC